MDSENNDCYFLVHSLINSNFTVFEYLIVILPFNAYLYLIVLHKIQLLVNKRIYWNIE